MRIAYTCHDSFPSSDTNTHQIFWTTYEMARRGVEVDLFTPSSSNGVPSALADVAAYYGADAGTSGGRLSLKPAAANSPASGPLGKGWFDWTIPGRIPHASYDLLWTRDALALTSAVRRARPAVFETFRPDFAERAAFELWRRASLRSPHLRGLITHSKVAAAAFVAAGVPRDRCLVAHNGFAPSLMQPVLDRETARAQLGLKVPGGLVVYAGHVGPEKGTRALVEMAAAVPDVTLLLLGVDDASSQGSWVREIATAACATNVLLRPQVRLVQVAPYLYAADCLVIPPTDEPLRRFRGTVLPLKVFTYMAAGRAILAPRLPDIEEVLEDGRTAKLVEPQPGRAAHGLRELLDDERLRARLSANAYAESARYTWAARAERIERFFRRLNG